MTFRRKTCKHCRRKLEPPMLIHPECIDAYAEAQEEKAKRKAEKQARMQAKVQRAEDRKKREALKTIPKLISEAQREFNAYIRARDAGKPCICCGKPFEPNKPGGSMDAGHYLSRGAAGHLRFNENNVFGQRKNCNRPGGTTRAAFRAGVIERIGLEAVEALEADNTVRKWTADELREIKRTSAAKRRELEKSR